MSRDGVFKIQGNQKIMYAVMMRVRAAIIKHAGVVLAKALLIGTRYAVCRR